MSIDFLNTKALSECPELLPSITQNPISPIEDKVTDIASEAFNTIKNVSNSLTKINPAQDIVDAGIEFEKFSAKKLAGLESESNNIIESIDLLLDLSREIGVVNAEKPVLTAPIKKILQDLENRGIKILDLSKGDTITKDQFITLKTVTSTHVDKLRTQLQQIFNKMQTIVQNMSSVNDTVKKMISEQSDLIRKVSERSIKR